MVKKVKAPKGPTLAGDPVVYGWRSLNWIGGIIFALGLFGMSAYEERAHPPGSRWRSPQFVFGSLRP